MNTTRSSVTYFGANASVKPSNRVIWLGVGRMAEAVAVTAARALACFVRVIL